jgi:hypothetical protein
MKKIATITVILATSFTLTSCFLFKGGGGHSKPCPAYGQIKTNNSVDNFAQNNQTIETKW